jgi:hypothetical protein
MNIEEEQTVTEAGTQMVTTSVNVQESIMNNGVEVVALVRLGVVIDHDPNVSSQNNMTLNKF